LRLHSAPVAALLPELAKPGMAAQAGF